ncbi:exonuclease domain-containing protein [Saccharicrinis sp. FJH62]|uniref:3'-5' exonuclease n=1 Tax=Saccharicrinis sp. FJH62 TaxID=3344657 RepID=UPI0035D3E5FA
MKYILFLDTETSGVPKHWDNPVLFEKKWPYILQISWVIYDEVGKKVKSENHYIKPGRIRIKKSSRRIHGITLKKLEKIGEDRKEVVELLAADFEFYQPLVVGHFLEFDRKMLDVGFHRSGVQHDPDRLKTFCTMQLTHDAGLAPSGSQYLRLQDLYRKLFNKNQQNPHNALNDAETTASCFFELQKRGIITDQVISDQVQKIGLKRNVVALRIANILLWLIVVTAIVLILKYVM